jgi:hypothetical protein
LELGNSKGSAGVADGDGFFKSPLWGDDTNAFLGATALLLPALLCVLPALDLVVGDDSGGD